MRSIAIALLLISCNEYDLAGQDEPNNGVGAALAQVTPESVLGATCGGEAETQVSVSNAGDAALFVTGVEVTSGAWTASPPSLPLMIQPDESVAIPLNGTGSGTLVIETSAPDQATLTVPLEATVGAPPEVTITAPTADAVLSIGTDVDLIAQVVDVDQDPSDLEVTWTSDRDGVLGTSPVDATGLSTLSWPGLGRDSGPHTLTATVDHPCGDTATTVDVCQQGGYVEDELDLASWHFEGSASWDATNEWLQITPALSNQVGSAFETSQTVRGDDVVVRFSLFIGDGSGADGMSFTMLDTSRMTTFLGGDGCGLGFGYYIGCNSGPALPGYTVEFDTYYNEEVDPTQEDHVAFYVDGALDSPIAWAAVPGLEDSGWHDVVVTVQEPAIEVSIDGNVVISQFLTGSVNFDFPAHAGFTAGTGYFHNLHLVDALQVEQLDCPAE